MNQNSLGRICVDLDDLRNTLDIVFDKIRESAINFKCKYNFTLLPTSIFSLLFLINLLTPSIVEVTGCKHANVISFFRSIFCLAPFLALLSWMLYVKSLIIGITAALIWKSYFLPFVAIRVYPDKHGILWIIIQTSTLFVNLSIFILATNVEILEMSGYLIYFLLCAKFCVGPLKIFLFRPPFFYLQESKNKTLKIVSYLLNIVPKEVTVFFLLLSFTFVEYLLVLHYKDVRITFSGRDMTLLSTTAFLMIIGHIAAGVLKRKFESEIISFVMAQVCHGYASLMIIADVNTSNNRDDFVIRSTLAVSAALFGFGDACYSYQNDCLTMVFTDESAEVFALIKFTQILIIGLILSRSYIGITVATLLCGILVFAGMMGYFDSKNTKKKKLTNVHKYKPVKKHVQICEPCYK